MSFSNMTGAQGGAWTGYPPHGHPTPPPQPPQAEDSGLQMRPMGRKHTVLSFLCRSIELRFTLL